ncbi:phospholipase B1, membrane-associated [Silurus asotus]|uniref:Phospholipase B1, membrane-associated n=1 Tax=Silurus asotus TaxID=30991 RepID=A0AAD5ALP4_SILAS|nr:phospholipase B1, membrane-associated [Silurus asotus]
MGTPGLLTASQLFILMLLSSAHSGHSVHSLRPADVSALSVLGLSTAHRSAEVKIVSRLSEILSSFNPKMTTLIPEQRSLIEEAEDVVQSLDNNQWKLLLVFVSVNEICICSDQAASSTVESVVHKVEEVLNKLHEKLDHALVHVAVWGGRDGGRICDCEEDISADTQTWRELERATMMTNIQDSLGALLQRHQQWSEEENFTVVLQSSPTYFDWSDDLLQPMTSEEEEEGRGMAVSCPSHEKPYLYTQHNSAIQPERKSPSAELRINPAGNGVGQNGVLGVLTEYRGLSWSIGGNGDLSSVTTLPNILRKFNPSLTGFSTGTGKASTAKAFLNQAVAGAESKDLPSQARALIARMKSDSRIDFQNDWKVITLLIGGNDLCEQCTDPDFYSAENFAKNIGVALDILQEEVPRVLVNLVELFDIVSLRQLHQDSKLGCPTWLVRSICPCVVNPAEGSSELQALIEMNKAYQIATRNLVDSGGYNTHTDFTVVLQPFFRNTTFPVLPNGTPDRSFFAGDCFHLSQKSHTLMARALWNNMLEPEHSKTTSVDFNEDVAMKCPSEDWGSDFSCTHTAPSNTVPSSVHRLRPGDINIIAALGDSITAGFRAKSTDILQQLLNEDRGVSWRDIPGQVRDLVEALKSSTSVDLDQDWKLVTLFIGVNDLCEYCENPTSLSPKKYVGHIRDALDILYNEVPRVLDPVSMFSVS